MFTTRPPRRRAPWDDPPEEPPRGVRRRLQFNVRIEPDVDAHVTGVCAVLQWPRRQLFVEALDALLGRRPPLSAAQLQALDALLREWQRASRPDATTR